MDNNTSNTRYQKNDYTRRDFLRGGAAGLAALSAGGCMGLVNNIGNLIGETGTSIYKTVEGGVIIIGNATEGLIKGTGELLDGTSKFLNKWVDNGVNNYESLDVYVYGGIGDRKRLDAIIYGIGHFLPHYVANVGEAFHATFVGVPNLAMERAKAQKLEQYGPNGPSFTEVKGPIEALVRAGQGVYTKSEDTARFLANYAGISGSGFIAEVTQKPLNSLGKAYLTVQIIDLASDGPLDWEGTGDGKGGDWFKPLPPAPPYPQPPGGGN